MGHEETFGEYICHMFITSVVVTASPVHMYVKTFSNGMFQANLIVC